MTTAGLPGPGVVIDRFAGEWEPLSNFHQQPVVWQGRTAPAAEYHFVACKTLDPLEREAIYRCATPRLARQAGRGVTLRPGWDERVRFAAMLSVLRAKFSDPGLAALLSATGEALLIEGNTWHDQVWGCCGCAQHRSWPGENHLGRTLMRIRHEQRAAAGGDRALRFGRVALTGHRRQHLDASQQAWVREELGRVAVRLRDEFGCRVAMSGLATGADTWWADAALAAGLNLWAYVPFEEQARNWPPDDQAHWRHLLATAARRVALDHAHGPGTYHVTDDWTDTSVWLDAVGEDGMPLTAPLPGATWAAAAATTELVNR